MFRKIAFWVYVLGGWLHVIFAGIATWRELPFMQWWEYVGMQLIYAPFWPIVFIYYAVQKVF